MNRRLVRFDFEKSPLRSIVYGATGKGKTYTVRQYSKLNLDDKTSAKPFGVPRTESVHGLPETHQEQDNKIIIIVCKMKRIGLIPRLVPLC